MWKKRIHDWLKVASPIISIVSLAGCVALSVVCVIMGSKISKVNDQITKTNAEITNYAEEPHFIKGETPITLLDIIRQHEQLISDLYNGQRQIRYDQSNLQNDLNRSNSFLDDYNRASFFDDDWHMKKHY